MTPYERGMCHAWITRYIRPSETVNHIHTSVGLRTMIERDIGVSLTERQFRSMMGDAGYEPADPKARVAEYRISSKPLRMRRNSTVGGWTAAARSESLTRRS